MSAPRTNLEKQKRRHWGPLLGIGLVALFGVILLVLLTGKQVSQSNPPASDAPGGAPASSAPAEVIAPSEQPGASGSPTAPPTVQPSPGAPSGG